MPSRKLTREEFKPVKLSGKNDEHSFKLVVEEARQIQKEGQSLILP